ncbi:MULTISPECIES: hypothetical protein [unclassified Streptomyces]|uniref:hypothetical protein n=1 Tax=unclassified Streptomyces TaxID=2593676 RepID=UPI000B82364E|nr:MULTISPECIES: hypothetical protein [unclassified Streptomyces]MYQ82237.1 hypothetical protein [Streptomyces sp. SID4936]
MAWLLLEGPPALSSRISSLRLHGVQVTGVLDLEGCAVLPCIGMEQRRFEKEELPAEARLTTLRLVDASAVRRHDRGLSGWIRLGP